jgi:hypothetical protein
VHAGEEYDVDADAHSEAERCLGNAAVRLCVSALTISLREICDEQACGRQVRVVCNCEGALAFVQTVDACIDGPRFDAIG